VLFVLGQMLAEGGPAGRRGCVTAFGPGLLVESMRFATV
jgi:predicted naringenin-chalcone synthase